MRLQYIGYFNIQSLILYYREVNTYAFTIYRICEIVCYHSSSFFPLNFCLSTYVCTYISIDTHECMRIDTYIGILNTSLCIFCILCIVTLTKSRESQLPLRIRIFPLPLYYNSLRITFSHYARHIAFSPVFFSFN